MTATGTMIRTAMDAVGAHGGQMRSYDELAVGLDGALRQAPAGLTADGCCAFAATMAQEGAYHRTTTEYGDLRGADYYPEIGRTFEMITWKDGYRRFGAWCAAKGLVGDPDVFVNNVTKLADYEWAWLGGVWYFAANGLWDYANRGDFYAVSQGVNRGPGKIGTDAVPNGWEARRKMYEAYQRVGGAALLPAGTAPPPAGSAGPSSIPTMKEGDVGAHVWRLAKWFNTWFPSYQDTPIPLDANPSMQRYGPTTVRVVREFQSRAGVTGSDAIGTPIGPRTKQALWDTGYRP